MFAIAQSKSSQQPGSAAPSSCHTAQAERILARTSEQVMLELMNDNGLFCMAAKAGLHIEQECTHREQTSADPEDPDFGLWTPDPKRDPDRHQNCITWSLSHALPLQKISSKSVHKFASNPTDRQTNRLTDRQTDKQTAPKT